MRKYLVPFCLITCCASSVYAANSQTVTSTKVSSTSSQLKSSEKKEDSNLSVKIELSADTNLKEQADAEYDANTSLYVEPSYKITRLSTLRLRVGIDKALVDEKTLALSNTTLTLARNPIPVTKDTKFTTSLFGVLPTNQADRDVKTLQGGTGVTAGAVTATQIFGQNIDLSYTISGLKNYHTYTRASDETANISHRIRQILSVESQITKKISLSLYGYYQTGWTYDSVLKQVFYLEQSLSYDLDGRTELSLSHTNNGNAFRANGVDSNVEIYDVNASLISVSLTKVF